MPRCYAVVFFLELVIKLVSHAHAEEDVLYADLKERKKERADALEMIEEHRLAEREIRAMVPVDPSSDRWTAMMRVLRETTEHHFEEEELKVFPESESLYSKKEQEEMGEAFLALQKEEIETLKKRQK